MQSTDLMFLDVTRKESRIWILDQMGILKFQWLWKSSTKGHKELSLFKEMKFVLRVLEQEQKMVNLRNVLSAVGQEWQCRMYKWEACSKCRCKLSVQSVEGKVILMQRNAPFAKEKEWNSIQKRFKLKLKQGLIIMKKSCFTEKANRIQIRKLEMLCSQLSNSLILDLHELETIFTTISQYL